jgi:hypothetical protein
MPSFVYNFIIRVHKNVTDKQSFRSEWKVERVKLTNPHGPESFFENQQSLNYSRISQHFVEPEGLFPSSQEPVTGPCPEPDESRPYHPNVFL